MKTWITLTLISLANKTFEELNPKCGNLTVDILLHFQAKTSRVFTSAKENSLQQLSLTIRKSEDRKITISEQNFHIDIANGRLNAWFPENKLYLPLHSQSPQLRERATVVASTGTLSHRTDLLSGRPDYRESAPSICSLRNAIRSS